MNVFVIGFLIVILMIGIYESYKKEEHLSLVKSIASLNNGIEKDKLLKQKSNLDRKEEIITTIYVILVVISMIYGTLS